jgi:tetratricopeptide (TPR) repeat protein
MRATLVCGALTLVVCGFATGAARQPTPYRQVVDRYRTSPNDGVERMLALSESERQAGIEEAVAASGATAWPWEEIAAAAMMHTDAGLYFLSRKQPGIPHLVDAERLLSRGMLTTPGHGAFVRRWFTTVESIVEGAGDRTNAKWFEDKYKDRFKGIPDRAKALAAYHRGVFAEYDGCQKGEFLTITGLTESGGNLVQRYFVPAGRELAAALVLDPDLLEAALHLGRVRMLEGRDAEAVPLLERAAASKTRSVSYLAKLFLGAFDERASQWDAAEARYRGALAVFPTGQSAAVALAQLLDRRGRTADGAQTLAALLGRPGARVVDPWWVYFDEAGVENAMKIGMMRAEVVK